jgi:hypothetical protein
LCQTDFKRWMTGINRAALLALSTVVKQHAKKPHPRYARCLLARLVASPTLTSL